MITIESAVELAQRLKQDMDWDDLMPIVHFVMHDGTRGDELYLLADDGGGRVADAVRAVLDQAPPGYVAVLLITDGFMVSYPNDPIELPSHGDLALRWAAGQRDGITEVLTLLLVRRDGTADSACLPYNANARTWGEPVDSDTVAGPVLEAMVEGATGGQRTGLG